MYNLCTPYLEIILEALGELMQISLYVGRRDWGLSNSAQVANYIKWDLFISVITGEHSHKLTPFLLYRVVA